MGAIGNFYGPIDKEIDKIMGSIMKLISDLIAEINGDIRWLAYEFQKQMGEILKDGWGCIFFIIWCIGVAICMPYVAEALAQLGITQFIDGLIQMIAQDVAIISQSLHLREILLASDLLYIAWEDYRKYWEPLQKAMSSLSETLGQGTSFLNLFLQNIKGVITVTATALALPKQAIDLMWIDETSKILTALDKNFREWAIHPEKFLSWVEENVLAPYYTAATETQAAILEDIDKNHKTLDKTVTDLRAVKGAFDKLVTDLPDNMELSIMKWYGPIKKDLEEFDYKYIVPLQEKADQINTRLEQYVTANEVDKMRLLERAANPLHEVVKKLITNKEAAEEELRNFAGSQIHSIAHKIAEDLKNATLNWNKPLEIVPEMIKKLPMPENLSYEHDEPFKAPKLLPGSQSWQVGDY